MLPAPLRKSLMPSALSVVLAVLASVMSFASPAGAGTFVAFGPHTYPRSTGAPVPFSSSFTVHNPATQYVLQVQVSGVASAIISVNGVTVVFTSDFDMNETYVERPVALQASNVLAGEVRGKPDGAITVTIIGMDNDPPTISGTASPPANASGWNNGNVTVTFSADDAISGLASVTPPVTLTTEGANQTVTGNATDRAGNTASTTVSVSIDKMPPSVVIASPPDGAFHKISSLTVMGSATDALSGVEVVLCNGAPASFSGTEFTCAESLIEGTNTVRVEATDRAGNPASATVAVTLDTAPPSLLIISPANGATFSASPITVVGTATDATSGVAGVTCNNAPALVSGADFTCEIGLAEGSNTVVVQASDAAGNHATQSVTVTLSTTPTPAPNSIELTPSTLALVVDEPRQLALVDDYGRAVTGASWSVSDPSVAELSTSGMIILTGKSVGQVTITATWGNFSAQATASVFAGPDLPDGTIPWVIQATPGYSTSYFVHAQPVENMPNIYSVEEDGSGNVVVRALTIEGLQVWRKSLDLSSATPQGAMAAQTATTSQEMWLVKALGDNFGGLLLQTEDYDIHSQIIRLDGATGEVSWRYSSPWWLYYDWALHPNGTIFVGEIHSPDGYMWGTDNPQDYDIRILAIDGSTGVVRSTIPVPRSLQEFRADCPYVENWVYPFFSALGAPMVAPNGSMYVEAATTSWIGELFQPNCRYQDRNEIHDTSLLLLEVRPDGSYEWRTAKQDHVEGNMYTLPQQPQYKVGEVIPDGQGGLLAAWSYKLSVQTPAGWTWNSEARVEHISSSGQNEYTLPLPVITDPWYWYYDVFSPPNRSMVLGDNGVGFATASAWSYESNSMISKVVAFDVASGAGRWTAEPSGGIDMVAATAGSGLVGLVWMNDGTLRIARFDSNGQATYDAWLGGAPGTAAASSTSSSTVDPASITWLENLVGNYWLGWQYLGNGKWNAVPVTAAGVSWPWSVWFKPSQEDTRDSNTVVPLQVHRVDCTSWTSGSTAFDRVSEAIGFWAKEAGILFTLVPPVETVEGCDREAHPSDCPGETYDITSLANDGNPFNIGWLEVYRRFCGTPIITEAAQRSYCQPEGSQLLLTGDVGARGTDFGVTPAIGTPRSPLNLSAFSELAEGMTVAHELGHQLGLPHCNINTVAVPQNPSLYFCSPPLSPLFFYNLMYSGLLGPTQPFSWSTLNPAQRTRARERARRWAGE